MPTYDAPAAVVGGEGGDCIAGRRRDPGTTHRTIAPAALRRRRQVDALHRLGARAVGELLDELRRHHPGIADDIDRRIARYAALDRRLLVAVGGDRWPAPPVHMVADRP